jgi:hypothetical protein
VLVEAIRALRALPFWALFGLYVACVLAKWTVPWTGVSHFGPGFIQLVLDPVFLLLIALRRRCWLGATIWNAVPLVLAPGFGARFYPGLLAELVPSILAIWVLLLLRPYLGRPRRGAPATAAAAGP